MPSYLPGVCPANVISTLVDGIVHNPSIPYNSEGSVYGFSPATIYIEKNFISQDLEPGCPELAIGKYTWELHGDDKNQVHA